MEKTDKAVNIINEAIIDLHLETGKEWISLKEIYEKVLNNQGFIDLNKDSNDYKAIVNSSIERYCAESSTHTSEIEMFISNGKGTGLYKSIYYTETDNKLWNRKRVKSKEDWIKVLKNEKQDNNIIIETFTYLMGCKNFLTNGVNLNKALGLNAAPNLEFMRFGQRVIKLLGIPEQDGGHSIHQYWNIPFMTDFDYNRKYKCFSWILRPELLDALKELYPDASLYENDITSLFKEFINNNDPKEHEEKIKEEIQIQKDFIKKYDLDTIRNMTLEDYSYGRSSIDENGKNTFCYILLQKLYPLGSMYCQKPPFGVFYLADEHKYRYYQTYGDSVENAFTNIKNEICNLLIAGKNKDYKSIDENILADVFKGKLLATFYPNEYVPFFSKTDIDNFINCLGLDYKVSKDMLLEEKKKILLDYWKDNELMNNYSIYYYMSFLYNTFKTKNKEEKIIENKTLELVEFNYLGSHKVEHSKTTYRSRATDYEKINRNKKSVGDSGEQLVLNYEKEKLIKLGFNNLSEQVQIMENDAIGYDITSYDNDGKEIHIEVKTSSGSSNKLVDFYLTDNEYQTMKEDHRFNIYYVYDIKNNPKYHIVNKEVLLNSKEEYLNPVLYKINIDVEKK